MRYFIDLAYDGTAYHGWQVQPNGITVQETLQTALGMLLHSTKKDITGAGRTDAGVHARLMTAHFDTDAPIDTQQLAYKLNKLLPRDISIYRIYAVDETMHARFSAISRTYHYYVHTRKDAFLQNHSCYLYMPTDFEIMNQAARILLEYEDFTSFSKTGTQTATNLCVVTEAYWERLDDPWHWRFTITANRFLRNMVRAIVGTLLQVGQGKITIEDMRRVIEARDRCTAGDSVDACGLYLVDIKYPSLNQQQK